MTILLRELTSSHKYKYESAVFVSFFPDATDGVRGHLWFMYVAFSLLMVQCLLQVVGLLLP